MHSQQLTTSYPVLVCLLSTGTRIQIAMLGFNSIFRLSTVLQFHYISGAVNTQQAGPEARSTSQFTVPRLRASLPSAATTTSVTGSKRRYAAITSHGRHRPQPSSSLPPDVPLLSKAAREQEEYQQVLEVTLNLIASLGQITWTPSRTQLVHLCSAKQIARLRKIISATAPSAGTLRAHNLSFKRFLLWGSDRKLSPSECFLKTTNIDLADFLEKLAYLGCSVPKSTASEFGLVGQILGCACLIFSHSKVLSWPRSNLLARTMILKVLFRRNLFNSATCVKLSLFVSVLPILFILRWQLGSLCLPMRGYALKIPSG